jgi:cell division septation protein DedD
MKSLFLFFSMSLLFIIGCSSSQDTSEQNNEFPSDSVYVFDEVPSDENKKPEPPAPPIPTVQKSVYYAVQIGAFASQPKADEFANQSRKKLNREVIVSYGSDVNLWVVQLNPVNSKQEAEKTRNELWKIKEFTDSFIVKIER